MFPGNARLPGSSNWRQGTGLAESWPCSMAPPFRYPRAVSSRPRLPSLGYSFFIHGAVLGWVAFGPAPEKPKTLYEQLIAPNEHKLVWYRFSKKLPEVSPAERKPAPIG